MIVHQAGSMGFTIEYDSSPLVELVSKLISESHPLYTLINGCRSLLSADWNCQLVHVYQEPHILQDPHCLSQGYLLLLLLVPPKCGDLFLFLICCVWVFYPLCIKKEKLR
ncbi:hypothetical protein RchiOBHm_Chr1g0337381 [Rosa chinensis]|uniref:RNase H type-1 domain-containing protein n=1 Tax=Rosa chinensis TaxID=74649 RepID=A0A2P6SCX6_ROSCH|nr:hypothetical protein RchiOBHm_Chr1g0337381 [Rosa chinensis]